MKNFIWRVRRLSHRIMAFFIARLCHGIITALMSTCKIEVKGLEGFIETVKKGPCLLSVWHNRVTPMVYFLHRFAPQFRYAAVISNSRDGDFLASITCSYPQGRVIRVAHREKFLAVRDAIKSLKKGEIIIMTPDGPRGPRYQVKPGIVFAAGATSARIVGISWAADRYWQLPTWDHMFLPKPFSRVVFSFSDPFDHPEENRSKVAEILGTFLRSNDKENLEAAIPDKENWPR